MVKFGFALGLVVVMTALAFIPAQMVVWGLSLYHIDSGIWGPFLLVSAAESVVTAGVVSGIRNAS